MITITEEQVKELVNSLIDMKEDNSLGFSEIAFEMRKHGVEMAIGRINSRLLNTCRGEDQKYEVSEPILKIA
ncbi:hypothetical protein [Mucilaginibacter sp. 10I4]|uniref:hypothetical protein n=1 Tax=Mucilaginibacter sp. 10I4 TaxID=3048580 RepID=UPI002B23B4D2|nr:hypothetical protein [Mucilaginibacter sp. 10I4]MEB0262872.1 hypothetical protein [Mucilaginibacter sp. 10I4]